MATEADRHQRLRPWELYARRLAELMHLQHWTVAVSGEEPPAGNTASVLRTNRRYCATILLSDHFLADSPENQRDTIVHELIHVHMAMVDNIAEHSLNRHVHAAFDDAMEYAVDLMARGWSSLLPLPPEPSEE